ncbi:BREX-1 system adenine-specific DNA-methyltransferase PglX [Nitrincola iocasae]|uniref:site-specific DNA-methyltransferase (adenine-specific) n=1 Tax=Nitrincola iocasae TaxID=2614693 RepID=A0A5J6LBU2_9GAMM|nr:BREX-1 system adenine-specific DNA-methyltransferase PglX [Nitrincola iocasae]QEW05876.1 BREX-1 system adenine-specific DNA-methyltransferase PglX [Nitrincola iocasae]
MAFDQTTRGRLQKFVNASRELLSEELTRQLQATYGLDPKTGTVADLSELKHLDNRERQTAQLLREILQHYIAATPGKNTKEQTLQSLDRLVREQAFTVLNRMAALRMMEARDVLMESIAKGYNSRGFELYKMLSGTSQGETGDAYRNYLFSLFDEFSVDLELLFDRHGAQGQLFPRESALLELLEQINHPEIEHLWAEDETIGWIYQYFNSQEERKKMRKESQAPRNSRELAVRNQFFTPRYVVEFLVDNTLGRIWFDVTQGSTSLYDRCQYLLVKPEELEAKRAEPATRTLRDPRTLKLLDPACGSMHFGLYAFDLFLEIYREAWAWEQQQGPGSLDLSTQTDAGFKPLIQTYTDEAAYLRDVPRLIIEHNIYGVDIDPRAAQIATLALWLRAQRAWYEAGVKAPQRPIIGQGHVIAAIAPPAEKELRQQFAEQLDKKDAELFEKTLQLLHNLPELGVLLQVEQELPKLIKQVYGGSGYGLFAAQEQETWQQAEQRLRQALSTFTEQVSSSYQSRLFALDALQGLRLIDLTREVFDVVVMNPPFGEACSGAESYISKKYPNWNKNILCVFIERLSMLLCPKGYLASVIDRSPLNKSSYSKFRESILLKNNSLEMVLDLGWGVLDANVEVSSVILGEEVGASELTTFIDSRKYSLDDKSTYIYKAINDHKELFVHKTNSFAQFPNSSLVYELSDNLLDLFSRLPNFSNQGFTGYTGHQLQSDRHFRLFWELPLTEEVEKNEKYVKMYNGGEFVRYVHPRRDVAIFGPYSKIGSENFPSYSYRLQNKDKHFLKGVGFGVRGDILDSHLIDDDNTIFTVEGQCIPISHEDERWLLLAILNSQITSTLLNTFSGQHKYSGYTNLLPIAAGCESLSRNIINLTKEIHFIKSSYYKYDETTVFFDAPYLITAFNDGHSVEKLLHDLIEKIESDNRNIQKIHHEINCFILKFYGIKDDESISQVKNDMLQSPDEVVPVWGGLERNEIKETVCFEFINYLVGCLFGRFDEKQEKVSCIVEDDTLNGLSYLISDRWLPIFEDLRPIVGIASGRQGISTFFTQTNKFFEWHLKKFTCSRRPSPVYWPLQTPSGSYTLWVYYNHLNEQTLYACINDFVDIKIEEVLQDLNSLRGKPARSRQEDNDLEKLSDLSSELYDFRYELLQLAKFWKPNLNDGVQITAAPLWKLFQHKAWQKKLKETWVKLEKGDYDWAHLALNYWPDRVLCKCHEDRSLAIAHDVEEEFWEEVEVPVIRRGKDTGETKLEWQPKDLSEAQLQALIHQVRQELSL